MMKKELAAALGVSAAMVTKLARRGMPTDSVERAQRWRRRHLEPSRVKGMRADTRPAVTDCPAMPPPMPDDGNQDDMAPADFLASRARREAAEAALAEIRLAEQRGEVIRVDAVRDALALAFSQTREGLMQLPDRMAQQLAAETDAKAVRDLLGAEIHRALTQLASGTPPALRPD